MSTILPGAEETEMKVNSCLRKLSVRKSAPQGSVVRWEKNTRGFWNTVEKILVTPKWEGFLEEGNSWLNKALNVN